MEVRAGDPLSDRDYLALARFRHALRVFLRFSERAARDAGVTPAQHQLLLAIRGYPGPAEPSTTDLADLLQLQLHSVVELAARAEHAGLVARHPDPHDARRQRHRLTDSGRQVLEELSSVHRDELRRFRSEMQELLQELG